MFLKRIYEPGTVSAGAPKVAHLEVLHAGQRWNLTPKTMNMGIAEGWLTVSDGKCTLKTSDGPLEYLIVRAPGTYNGERRNYFETVRA